METDLINKTRELEAVELKVSGMTCTNCALGVEKYLEKEGLASVYVDFASGEVNFLTPNTEGLPKWIKGIESLGFEVEKDGEEEKTGLGKVEKYFWFSLIFTIPLLLHMFVPWHFLHNPIVQLCLSLPVFVLGMGYFGKSAIQSLKSGIPNMDVLISIGAIAAFGYSLYGLIMNLGPDFLFFETAASVITLVLLGNLIEHRAVQKTTISIKELQDLQPKFSLKKTAEGNWEKVAFKDIQEGDSLLFRSGERISVDGYISNEGGEVDESVLTGEALPLRKKKGDVVHSGGLVVEGQLEVKASKVGKFSSLSQIIDLVKKAQADKPNIQRLADKISSIFVPAVLALSLLTFILNWAIGPGFSEALIRAVAVLVIACPCAMGLATPTAVVVGIGRASKNGILIKGGRVLEQFSEIRQVVFDKTGTLTTGNFKLKKIQTANANEFGEVGTIVKSLEQYSNHPIAKSLVSELKEFSAIDLRNVKEVKGIGISGEDMEGNAYQIGSFRIVEGLLEKDIHTLYILKNGKFWAGIDLEDEIREGALEMIQYLQEKGIKAILLSGDRIPRCETVAKQLGIEEYHGEMLPAEKLAKVEELAFSSITAMVGDGINDAPALARAHVGISLGEATEIAKQNAQVILLNGRIKLLPMLFDISKHSLITIRQNL
ncbi:MAG: cadmium-translocating P-type ATPase, partial [Bacteroidia bacterium]|nr:cadmium-translocating P-type ATPase [Bacteroidia bacterium]